MKLLLLKHCIPTDDVDFLNITPIQFEFYGNKNDSGWCDMTTGYRILNASDKIIFFVENNEEEVVLKYKFGDRLELYYSE